MYWCQKNTNTNMINDLERIGNHLSFFGKYIPGKGGNIAVNSMRIINLLLFRMCYRGKITNIRNTCIQLYIKEKIYYLWNNISEVM